MRLTIIYSVSKPLAQRIPAEKPSGNRLNE
jgi:hypothetical protein